MSERSQQLGAESSDFTGRELDSSRAGSGFPIIVSQDISKLLGFYRDVMGGRIVYQFPDEDPAFLTLRIGSATLGIGYHPDPPRGPSQMSLWFYVADLDATLDLVRNAGIVVLEQPEVQAWGERMARVMDPTGIEVILGEDEVTSASNAARRTASDQSAVGGSSLDVVDQDDSEAPPLARAV
ncbi:VOC family protein [Naasia lichenicola]|nr:VOC family protein [Naasia lichenicola]